MTMSDAWSPEPTLSGAARPSLEALFSYGFRPFFLGAAVFTVLWMCVWLVFVGSLAAGLSTDWLPVAGSPFAWHAHEMVFGFAAAAIAGFLLTAVPNWTGALPLSGSPLVILFLTWLAGRLAMALSGVLPYLLAAGIDVLFLPLLGAFAAQQLFVKPAARNLVFLLLLAAMTLSNVLFHLGTAGRIEFDPLAAARNAMLVVAVMIAIIGGRIIPAFTHNWIHLKRAGSALPRRVAWLDAASVLSIVLFATLTFAGLPEMWLGATAAVAAGLNGARLWLWRGWTTRSEPIVWVLHLGYAWIVVGLGLSAASAFQLGVPGSLASHAIGTGAAGTMIMAVMSRASLGHTGRPLVAPRPIVWAYLLLTLSAVLRVAGPLLVPAHQGPMLAAAALAWIAAFALFVVVYAPILTTPRVHTKLAAR